MLRVSLTAVEDGGVHPALRVAHRLAGAVVAQQDVGAASPGSGRHAVGVVPAPAAHQDPVVVPGVQLEGWGGGAHTHDGPG